ncbi:hypothetical protein HO173_006397 [Letharia columbiana]|uniref:Uncharacterized protein n=1 Tax=Letharia columbiana TaxID=112416 RepID=A0A8H6L4H3_9LECA|nr:uncharacterized protein HO173_006397 [Letharia columbiana]KAF6235203.1 hypothetical protein HO173_006397 [Letharia columbiana]
MNHELAKRHFWCNGVDSKNICPEAQTMVPIDEYACDAISSAGRMSQISPPVNGEESTTCQQQAPAEKLSTRLAVQGSLESSPIVGSTVPMHLTCTEIDGATGSSLLLNCTTAA